MGASAPHTKRVQSCQCLSHNTLGAEEQVIIVTLSPSSPLSWLGFFFLFSKNKRRAAWKSKLEFELRKYNLQAAALAHKAQIGKHLGDLL